MQTNKQTIFPWPLGWISKIGLTTRLRFWQNVESQSPFRDLGGHPSQIIPDLRLGWSPKPNHPCFETWVCRHRRKIRPLNRKGCLGSFSFIFLDTDPHLASFVCDLYLFSVSRYELCVCGNLCTCVRVSTNLESPPTMGNFKVWLGTYV